MLSVLNDTARATGYECRFCGADIRFTFTDDEGRLWTVPDFGSCGCPESQKAIASDNEQNVLQAERYDRAGIPALYRKAGNVEPRWINAIAKGKGIYFYGANFTGKTTAACAIAKKMVDDGYSVRFENLVSLLTELKGYFDGQKTNAMKRAIDCQLLVIDDIGQEIPTGWARGVVYEIVNTRFQNDQPIVYTSNFTLGQLAKVMGDDANTRAIASRIAATTVAEKVER